MLTVSEFVFALPLVAILEIAPLLGFPFRELVLLRHVSMLFFPPAEIRHPGYRFFFLSQTLRLPSRQIRAAARLQPYEDSIAPNASKAT